MNRNINKNLLRRILIHVFFWMVFFSLLFFMVGTDRFDKKIFFIDVPIILFYSYITAYYLIPEFLAKRKFVSFVLLMIGLSLFLSFVRLKNYDFLYYSMYISDVANGEEKITFPRLVLNAKDFSFGLMIFLAVKYTREWIFAEKELTVYKNELLESELNLVNLQIDPHFLFNTLNNIYSLSVARSERTIDALRKVWGLIDYVLNQSGYKLIEMDKEIKLIQDYVDLERLRYGERLEFEMKINGELKDYRIPPLLLFPLVQNCFRFGTAGDPDHPWIKIIVKEERDTISFITINSFRDDPVESSNPDLHKEVTQKMKNKLDVLLPGRYKLRTEKKQNEFYVKLELLY